MDRLRGHAIIGLSAAVLLLAGTGAGAQGAAGQPDPCGAAPPGVITGGVTITPQRGWQMQGRDVELAFASAALPADGKPIVCFRWQLEGGGGQFVQAGPVRVVQAAPAKIAVAVPDLGVRPPRKGAGSPAGVYTPDNAAPYAEVRVMVLDAQGKTLAEAVTAVAIVAPGDFCNVPRFGAYIDSGAAVPVANKNWQPAGGGIDFAIASAQKAIPTDAMARACFRWKLTIGDPGPFSDTDAPRVLERQSNAVKLAITVPQLANNPERISSERQGTYAVLGLLVPIADARLLIFDSALNPVIDAWTTVGITSVFFAVVTAIAVLGIAFLALWLICRKRLGSLGAINPILCLVATRRGNASLSQLQIMLWTFVVVGSAAYVIALSGNLIPITTGTLVLLGISGTAAVISKAKTVGDAADPTAAAKASLDKAVQEANAATAELERVEAALKAADQELANARASNDAAAEAEAAHKREAALVALDVAKAYDAAKEAARNEATALLRGTLRHGPPRWSDLVMDEVYGREIDVARVQMLYFTLVTAAFVVLKVITSYEIPDIPEGFLILMGISNSVYVGSKFAGGTPPK